MMRAAHREHGGACRKAFVEDIDLGVRIAAELKRQQREQHRLAGAGRADDDLMTDVADMGGEPERCRAGGLRDQQRRPAHMRVAGRTEEHTSELQSLMRISYADLW